MKELINRIPLGIHRSVMDHPATARLNLYGIGFQHLIRINNQKSHSIVF